MNRKTKYSMSSICILGVLFGRFLNRVLTNYFGNNSSNIIVAICISVFLCLILLAIVTKQYIIGIIFFLGSIPLIVGGIGLYLDNMELVGLGILLIFIIYPIMIIAVKWFRNNS